MNQQLAYQRHNHQHCIDSAVQQARACCSQRGVRLTPQREDILRLVWQSHKPLGAYAIMELLANKRGRAVAPPTVYRALDFLVEQQLIHRVHSLNAFIGCPEPDRRHQNHFLICSRCGITVECGSHLLQAVIDKVAQAEEFEAQQQSLEIRGLCAPCRQQDGPSD